MVASEVRKRQDEGGEGNKVEVDGEANRSIGVKLFGNNVRNKGTGKVIPLQARCGPVGG